MSESKGPEPERASRIGRFIQSYSSFLSSFVIGMAGLVATSIWQYRQSQNAARQAESEQAIARTKADNDWRIARAEILAKNLSVLSSQSPDTADQRFGVLLSLTRGSILDPELAVSYALELGKSNPTFMRSVLAGTADKNYTQLEQAYALTCLQRYGVAKRGEICRDDKLAERSAAIASFLAEEIDAAMNDGDLKRGPLQLLRDERSVAEHANKLAWLFEEYLQGAYERRQWRQIERFEGFSTGARLIAALVLATARTGELLSAAETAQVERAHAERRQWLVTYMFSPACDGACRAKLMQAMLSWYGESDGDYDEAFQRLLLAPRAANGTALAQLHARLLWCQMDGEEAIALRDRVLVPTLTRAAADAKMDAGLLEDLAELVGLVPEPTAGSADGGNAAVAAWKQMLAGLASRGERLGKALASQRARARRERAEPPPMVRGQSFCQAESAAAPAAGAGR
jgi:hypothetical protein